MKTKILAIILFATVILSGCVSTAKTATPKLNPDDVAKVKQGVTTYKETIALLGTPDTNGISNGLRSATWFYTKLAHRPQNFIPIAGLLAGGIDQETQMCVILFDEDNVVYSVNFNDSDTATNYGILNQGK